MQSANNESTQTAEREAPIWEALRYVIDPELYINIVDLGLVYEVLWADDGMVYVRMTLTTPGCPVGGVIIEAVNRIVGEVPAVSGVEVDLTFDPRWSPDRITPEGRLRLAGRS